MEDPNADRQSAGGDGKGIGHGRAAGQGKFRRCAAARRYEAWRRLSRCEAELGGQSRFGILGTMRYDSQGRDFACAPSPQVRNDSGGRVSRLRAALEDSPRLAMREIAQRFDQLDFGIIGPILTGLVHDIALYIGTGAVAGAGLGAFFGGGIGAVPGALVGADAGLFALNLIGMASLVGELAKVLPDALRHYLQGFREAWGAVPEPGQPYLAGCGVGLSASATYGAHEIAQGHVLILAALLMGVMLWICKGGAARSKLLAEIRANPRMGAPMANWVEASESRFPKQLQDIAGREASAGGKGALPKATPVPAKGPAASGGAASPQPTAKPPTGAAAPARASGKPDWLKRIEAGNEFNRQRAPSYPNNEVYIDKPSGDGYYRLDSYNPDSGEIVSRKFTQLSDIQPSTATSYINEIPAKYPVGATVADVPSSGSLAGATLQGQYILEVPVQVNPVPQAVLDAANNAGVVIRDVTGHVY